MSILNYFNPKGRRRKNQGLKQKAKHSEWFSLDACSGRDSGFKIQYETLIVKSELEKFYKLMPTSWQVSGKLFH